MSGMHRHLNEEELLLHLYGAAGEDAGRRVAECAECGARWRRLQAQRAALLQQAAQAESGAERLRAQRLAVWRKVEGRRRAPFGRVLQAAAAACVLLAAVVLHRPGPDAEPRQVAAAQSVSDAQLFEDLAAALAQDTPRAAEPLKALFVTESTTEVR